MIACILTGIYCFKKFNSGRKSFVCCWLSAASFALVIGVALLVEHLTDDVILLSGVTYFVPYLICASWMISKYLNCSFVETFDLIALAYLPARAVNIIGCTFSGCCQGIPVEWGIYSSILKTRVVPVQLYESAAIFVIWTVINHCFRKHLITTPGKCAAWSITLFGGLNVITDIFTYIQPKIIYMVSVEGIFSFITMSIGLILLYYFSKNEKTNQSCVSSCKGLK